MQLPPKYTMFLVTSIYLKDFTNYDYCCKFKDAFKTSCVYQICSKLTKFVTCIDCVHHVFMNCYPIFSSIILNFLNFIFEILLVEGN